VEKGSSGIDPATVTAAQVKSRTEFDDVVLPLSFVLTVCDGDFKSMTYRASCLTWFEDWFTYLEFVYGKTIQSQSTHSTFQIHENIVRKVIGQKLLMVLWLQGPNGHDTLPTRKMSHWVLVDADEGNARYKDTRPMLRDNTGSIFAQALRHISPTNQQITYSSYYGGNVAKDLHDLRSSPDPKKALFRVPLSSSFNSSDQGQAAGY
jgi:hypothetical protein